MHIFDAIWNLFTNNGMYSNTETAIILVLSIIFALGIMYALGQKAEAETRQRMIADLGYQRYLDLLERVRIMRENR